jgi:hypothetical protein
MRKALLLLDFEDEDTGPFKTMLLACLLQNVYLKSDVVGVASWSTLLGICRILSRTLGLDHTGAISKLKILYL